MFISIISLIFCGIRFIFRIGMKFFDLNLFRRQVPATSSSINLIVIGVGPHSRRIYVPILFKLKKEFNVNLKLGIDVESQREVISEYLFSKKFDLPMHYFEPFSASGKLPGWVENFLDKAVEENNINGVIIATEPLSHKAYAMWALSRGLHVLMDKPITTRKNVVTDAKQAKGIYEDYEDILEAYKKLQKKKETVFTINVQRRFEAGHKKVFDLIREVKERFDAPITSIQSMHSDGVWILPEEIETQFYHPYFLGYGKVSHSGYHILDIVYDYYKSGLIEEKKPNRAELYSSFSQPDGLLKQFTMKDFESYFGDDYKKLEQHTHEDLTKKYKNYGEIDAFTILRLLKDKTNMCNISINLIHNGFSRRSWMYPDKDLYKGNGRVKHQYHYIQQGPFQCIQIHNYQANDKQDKTTKKDYSLGGNNHFDINVFRNSKMFGVNEKPLQTYHISKLNKGSFMDNKLYHESVKSLVVIEFLKFILGRISRKDLTSNIDDHEIPVQIMSSIYESHIKYKNGDNPIVKFPVNF